MTAPPPGWNPPPHGQSGRPVGGPYPPPGGPHPSPGGPRRPRRGRGLRIAGIVVLSVVVLLGAVVGLAYVEQQNRVGWVQKAPNEQDLQPFPEGEVPVAVGSARIDPSRSELVPHANNIWYVRANNDSISFSEHEPDYWQGRARGARGGGDWPVHGDMICNGGNGQFCMMKFTDRVLVANSFEMGADEVVEMTEAYLAALRGEGPPDPWHGVRPPNADRLAPIAGHRNAILDANPRDHGLTLPITESAPEDALTWWTLAAGGGMIPEARVTAFKDHSLWGYATAEAGMTAHGDALCHHEDNVAVCVLAGSDGMLYAEGLLEADQLADLLGQ